MDVPGEDYTKKNSKPDRARQILHGIIPFICEIFKKKIELTDSRKSGCQGLESRENRERLVKVYKLSDTR